MRHQRMCRALTALAATIVVIAGAASANAYWYCAKCF